MVWSVLYLCICLAKLSASCDSKIFPYRGRACSIECMNFKLQIWAHQCSLYGSTQSQLGSQHSSLKRHWLPDWFEMLQLDSCIHADYSQAIRLVAVPNSFSRAIKLALTILLLWDFGYRFSFSKGHPMCTYSLPTSILGEGNISPKTATSQWDVDRGRWV